MNPEPHVTRRREIFDTARIAERLGRLLEVAYVRPCFLCKQKGECAHREPIVEFAILGIDITVEGER